MAVAAVALAGLLALARPAGAQTKDHDNDGGDPWPDIPRLVAHADGMELVDPAWILQGIGDFDGDGDADVLWRDGAGRLAISFAERADDSFDPWTDIPRLVGRSGGLPVMVDAAWVVRGVGDFDRDGRADIVFHHPKGAIAIWYMNGAQWLGERLTAALPQAQIQTVTDFDGDGDADLLWRDATGRPVVWILDGGGLVREEHP